MSLFPDLDRQLLEMRQANEAAFQHLNRRVTKLMATLDQILETVSASNTKLDSVIALVDGLKQQVADALSGANLSPAVQAKVDAIFEKAGSNAAKISDALDENVPVEPTP